MLTPSAASTWPRSQFGGLGPPLFKDGFPSKNSPSARTDHLQHPILDHSMERPPYLQLHASVEVPWISFSAHLCTSWQGTDPRWGAPLASSVAPPVAPSVAPPVGWGPLEGPRRCAVSSTVVFLHHNRKIHQNALTALETPRNTLNTFQAES